VIELKQYQSLAFLLVIIGALNWLLVGLLQLNLVSSIFGANSLLEKVIYILVGLAGLWLAYEKWGKGGKK